MGCGFGERQTERRSTWIAQVMISLRGNFYSSRRLLLLFLLFIFLSPSLLSRFSPSCLPRMTLYLIQCNGILHIAHHPIWHPLIKLKNAISGEWDGYFFKRQSFDPIFINRNDRKGIVCRHRTFPKTILGFNFLNGFLNKQTTTHQRKQT